MRKTLSHPFALSLLIILGLVFLNFQGWLKIPQNIFFQITAPSKEAIYGFSLKVNGFVNFVFSVNQLNQENDQLKREKEELLAELAYLKEIEAENEFIRSQIGLPLSDQKELVLANIIGQDPSGLSRSFLINKGERSGISQKAVVITAGNILVGWVIEVFDSYSRIRIITDPEARVNAKIQQSGLTGLIKGGSGSNLILDLLPRGELIQKEEIVVSSGLAGLFPPGLLIGQVQRVISSDVDISQMAKVKPAVDFNSLTRVFVIK